MCVIVHDRRRHDCETDIMTIYLYLNYIVRVEAAVG